MTLNELIERLEEIRDASDDAGELTVVMAVQPGYPLREILRGAVGPEDELTTEDNDNGTSAKSQEIWLVSGGQSSKYDVSPYAPQWVFDAVE